MTDSLKPLALEAGVIPLSGRYTFTEEQLRQFAQAIAGHCAEEIVELAKESEFDGDPPKELVHEIQVMLGHLFD